MQQGLEMGFQAKMAQMQLNEEQEAEMRGFLDKVFNDAAPEIEEDISKSLEIWEKNIPGLSHGMFSSMDTNADGKVSRSEFEQNFLNAALKIHDLGPFLNQA